MRYEIIPADERRMAEIEIWLDEEEAVYSLAEEQLIESGYEEESPVRGFRCNWDSVKRGWNEGILL